MKYIQCFESLNSPINIDYDTVEDILLSRIEDGDIKVSRSNFDLKMVNPAYPKNLYNDKYISKYKDSVILKVEIKQPYRCRNTSFDINGYTSATLKTYFDRIYKNYDVNIFYIIDKTDHLSDYISKSIIFIQNKFGNVSESTSNDSTLLVVDVQKSFKKFFTDNFIKQLMKYSKQFTNVYQIWDNHVDGKNVDKDYLYDEDPDVPNHEDLYDFPNERDIIEKRYNYDVNVDFYKKILDDNTYKLLKQKEQSNTLQVGELYKTTQGTAIIYIGNNHVWYHCPKKLYDLFLTLKGKEIVMVGGSDQECFLDVEITAKTLGVRVKRNFQYIYSATNCPIK